MTFSYPSNFDGGTEHCIVMSHFLKTLVHHSVWKYNYSVTFTVLLHSKCNISVLIMCGISLLRQHLAQNYPQNFPLPSACSDLFSIIVNYSEHETTVRLYLDSVTVHLPSMVGNVEISVLVLWSVSVWCLVLASGMLWVFVCVSPNVKLSYAG